MTIQWPPFARASLDAATEQALARVETAKSFEALVGEYETVCAEGKRRAPAAFLVILLSFLMFSAPASMAYAMGGFRGPWAWAFLLAVPFATLMANALQGAETMRLETRLHRAIVKWRSQAAAVRRTS